MWMRNEYFVPGVNEPRRNGGSPNARCRSEMGARWLFQLTVPRVIPSVGALSVPFRGFIHISDSVNSEFLAVLRSAPSAVAPVSSGLGSSRTVTLLNLGVLDVIVEVRLMPTMLSLVFAKYDLKICSLL